MTTPDYLERSDLEKRVGAQTVVQLFDLDGDGLVPAASADEARMFEIMASAEAFAASYMLRGGWTTAQIETLADNDPFFLEQVAWVALEFGTEGRPQFTAADGKGRFWVQYERATKHFDHTSKSRLKSKGEQQAGRNRQAGGHLQPRLADGRPKPLVFGGDKNNPSGGGGF